jgi:hypothetical protein
MNRQRKLVNDQPRHWRKMNIGERPESRMKGHRATFTVFPGSRCELEQVPNRHHWLCRPLPPDCLPGGTHWKENVHHVYASLLTAGWYVWRCRWLKPGSDFVGLSVSVIIGKGFWGSWEGQNIFSTWNWWKSLWPEAIDSLLKTTADSYYSSD